MSDSTPSPESRLVRSATPSSSAKGKTRLKTHDPKNTSIAEQQPPSNPDFANPDNARDQESQIQGSNEANISAAGDRNNQATGNTNEQQPISTRLPIPDTYIEEALAYAEKHQRKGSDEKWLETDEGKRYLIALEVKSAECLEQKNERLEKKLAKVKDANDKRVHDILSIRANRKHRKPIEIKLLVRSALNRTLDRTKWRIPGGDSKRLLSNLAKMGRDGSGGLE